MVNHFERADRALTTKTGIVKDIDLRLTDAARLITLLTGLYDNVAQAGATYRRV